MASCSDFLSEEQFQCFLCLDVFTSPVSTPCGHSFCKACIHGYWDNCNPCQCPICGKRFHVRPDISTNTVIEEISMGIKRRRLDISEQRSVEPGEVPCDICAGTQLKAVKSCLVCLTSYCQMHLEPHQRVSSLKRHKLIDPVRNLEDRMCRKHERLLELFCRSDQTCVCVLCIETDHRTHYTVPAERAWIEIKTELKKTFAEIQQMMQDRLKKVEEIRQCVELSRSSTEREIEDSVQVFSALVRSIEMRQAKLTEEMEEKQREVERHAEGLIKELEQELTELQKRNTELEQLSHTEDHLHFLQSFPSLCTPPHTKDWSSTTVHTDVCVGTVRRAVSQLEETLRRKLKTLTETELKRIRKYKADIAMDPNTANCWLFLSEAGKRVKRAREEQVVSSQPDRFDSASIVLGQRGFRSGRHYWEVQVGVRHDWGIGVAKESVSRKGEIKVSPEHGFYVLAMKGFEYRALSTPIVPLQLATRPRKVGVFLDYQDGQVSFYDVEARSHIYTFTGHTFAEKLYPYFSIHSWGKKSESLVICAVIDHTERLQASLSSPLFQSALSQSHTPTSTSTSTSTSISTPTSTSTSTSTPTSTL